MDSGEFLNNLIEKLCDENTIVKSLGFDDVNSNFLDNSEGRKLIVDMSSSNFYKNLEVFSNLKNLNRLESIISLPIFKDDDNLLILIFNSDKTTSECLFIDESDSLLHKSDSVDWTYASDELIGKITSAYTKFQETDTSVILDIETIFPNTSNDQLATLKNDDDNLKRKNKSAADELLALKSDKTDMETKKHRVISNDVADGLLSLKQKQSLDEEISKHNSMTIESTQGTVFPFLNDAMYYKKRQNPENLLYKDDKALIDGEVVLRKLKKIADLKNIQVKNNNDSILIATCKGCHSKWVYYNKDITDFKGEVFIELTNVKENISIDYLYEYLSSSNGLNELVYYSKGNTHITHDDIKNIRIPIPPLDVQKEIVKVSRESREFFKSVELLKKEFNSNILDYKHMEESLDKFRGDIEFNENNEITKLSRNWRHAFNGLIWPLAISYLSATKGGFESVEKKDNYLVLFEFIAAFNSVILLSGLPDDVYQNNFDDIWNSRNPKEYHMMTFANWVYLSKNLSKVYRYNNFTSQLDEELFDKISSDKVLNILEDVKNIRNDESHGSHSNSYEAEKIIEKLDVYLEDIFDILDVYSNYKLIYVTGDIKSSKQHYNHRVILLNGPCAQPIYDNFIFDNVLSSNSLYLYNPKNNKKLLLKDNLIKFAPTDEDKKRWALFIYYSCDRSEFNASYRCFQSNEEDIRVRISSLKHDILGKS